MRRRGRHVPPLELAPGPSHPAQRRTPPSALFILDALAPMTDDALTAAADELIDHLRQLGPDVRVATRVFPPTAPPLRSHQ